MIWYYSQQVSMYDQSSLSKTKSNVSQLKLKDSVSELQPQYKGPKLYRVNNIVGIIPTNCMVNTVPVVSPNQFKSSASGCEGCARGSRRVKRLIMLRYNRQALVVHAEYKSRMTSRRMQLLSRETLRDTSPRTKADDNRYIFGKRNMYYIREKGVNASIIDDNLTVKKQNKPRRSIRGLCIPA